MNNEIEIWKDIPGYEGFYQVSDYGNVKSLSRLIYNGQKFYLSKEKILKGISGKNGYLQFILYKIKIKRLYYSHQLVAMAFLSHIPNGYKLVVDHINHDHTNNHVSNLQIVTHRYNMSKDKINCSSKYTGVSWNKDKNKWLSRIRYGKKIKHLGYYTNELEASKAYQDELKKHIS